MKPQSSFGSSRRRRAEKRKLDEDTMLRVWILRLHELYETGLTTREALVIMRGEVALSLKQHPNRAQDIRLAWNRYLKHSFA